MLKFEIKTITGFIYAKTMLSLLANYLTTIIQEIYYVKLWKDTMTCHVLTRRIILYEDKSWYFICEGMC